jgi:Leucine-rich repeat (LRR) protein
MSLSGYSQKVNIPDKNFEQALVDLKIDTDGEVNGYLLKSDAQAVTFLDVSNKKIKDLSGIEAFTSLSFLDCSNNQVSNLDLSNNIGLTIIFNDVNDLINPKTSFMGIVMMD